MNRVWLVIFAVAAVFAASCARDRGRDSDRVALTLQFSEQSASRVDALIKDDAAGVFARVDGSGPYVFANHRFVSDDLGKLVGNPVVYFPDAAQAVALCAYLPYVAGENDPSQVAYVTPVDQTSVAQCREADLLWGRTASTPVAAAVPIHFEHLLSRVLVAVVDAQGVAQTASRWSVHNVLIDGQLNVETGVFTVGATTGNVATTGRNELILVSQSIQTLDFTVGGVDYTFEATKPIVLEAGKSHTLKLTLDAQNYTATLTDPVQVSDWVVQGLAGGIEHAVRNTITAHWLLPHPDFSEVTKVELHVVDGRTGAKVSLTSTSYAMDPSSNNNVGQCSFTVGLDRGLNYPFRIEKIDFIRADNSVVQSCGTLLAQGIYRSGAVSFGIYQDNIWLVTTDLITKWDQESVVGGIDNIKYNGNTFRLKVIEPDFEYQKVAKVRLSIWGGVAEWDIAAPTVSTGFANFVVETTPFTFPDAKGYAPATRHYPIEWVELADAGGGYLYRGYCNLEVSEEGNITLLLYQKGAVYSPSTITRPIEEAVSGALDNVAFVGNTFQVRFVGADFIDTSRPLHTIRMGVLSDVFSWSGVSLDPASNFFTAWVDLKFPDQNGYAPTNQHYKILWVEVLDASGGYLYKSYCNVDITRSGAVTLDLHQRGVLSNPTTVTPPTVGEGESNPLNSTKYVANMFDIRLFEPIFEEPYAYWNATVVALTCSDGETYKWNSGLGWNTNNYGYARATPSWPDGSGARPAGYPFKITKIEVFSGATSIYSRSGLSVEVSAYGTVLFSLYK